MALPTSRNTTYSGGSPVKSADLDDLQDGIVAGWHGDLSLWLPASSWQSVPGGGGILGNGQWTFSAVGELVAPLLLPQGTFIDAIDWYYNRGGGGTVTTTLRQRNIVTAGVVADVSNNADATGAVHETFAMNPDHTMAANFAYWLRVQCDNAANVFVGARVLYRKGP